MIKDNTIFKDEILRQTCLNDHKYMDTWSFGNKFLETREVG